MWKKLTIEHHWAIVYVFSYFHTLWLTATRPISPPPSLSALITQPHYFLSTLNLSFTLPISCLPCLSLFRCHSSSHSLSTHLSVAFLRITQPFQLFRRLLPLIFLSSLFPVSQFLTIFLHIPQIPFPLCCITALYLAHHFSSLHFISKCLPLTPHPSSNPKIQLSLSPWFINMYTQECINTHPLLCSHTLIL